MLSGDCSVRFSSTSLHAILAHLPNLIAGQTKGINELNRDVIRLSWNQDNERTHETQ